jgi:hypothetical protein
MWFPTPDQVAFGVKEAGEVYKAHNALIWELFDVIRRGGQPTFVVFGPGGNGKSTLKIFLETLSENELQTKYEMDQIRETGKIKGRQFSNVTVFPGQPEYRDPQVTERRQWLQGIRRLFIVLCFSFGYRAVDVYQSASRDAFQANLQARQEELVYANDILRKIHTMCGFPQYRILSMILKQDLWWDEQVDVRDFYRNEYEPVIKTFWEDTVGKDHVHHHVFPMCLIRSNLKDRNGVIIKEGCGSYDEATRRMHTNYFLSNLRSILRAI